MELILAIKWPIILKFGNSATEVKLLPLIHSVDLEKVTITITGFQMTSATKQLFYKELFKETKYISNHMTYQLNIP